VKLSNACSVVFSHALVAHTHATSSHNIQKLAAFLIKLHILGFCLSNSSNQAF